MIAHISEDGCNRIQTVVEHTEGVYELCAKKAQKIHIANIARLCAIFHDIGKEKQRFQDYILADEIHINVNRFRTFVAKKNLIYLFTYKTIFLSGNIPFYLN